MLKLVLALPIFYPTFAGGPLRFMRYQPGLRKREIQARVLAGTARTKDDSHFEDDLGWHDHRVGSMLPTESVEGMPVHRVRLPHETGVRRTAHYFRALIALCRDPATRPDLVQLHSFERLESLFWLWRLRRLGIPILYAVQIARPIRQRSMILRFIRTRMLRAFYNGFDGIVANSDAISANLRNLGVDTPIAVISNGVDLDRFQPCEDDAVRERARRSLGVVGRGPLVLSVGAICPRKGTDLLIEAWTLLLERSPDAELVLVGPRHDRHNPNLVRFRARIEALIARSPHPDRVHLMGVRNDMNDVYAAADVVVLPSSREGMPNAVLEAMACERPVVLTPFAGLTPAIGRPGIEFEKSERSARDLSESIATLLADPDRRAEQVRHAKVWVTRHLDVESSLDQFAELYRQATDESLLAPSRFEIPAPRPLAPAVVPRVEPS